MLGSTFLEDLLFAEHVECFVKLVYIHLYVAGSISRLMVRAAKKLRANTCVSSLALSFPYLLNLKFTQGITLCQIGRTHRSNNCNNCRP